MWFCCATQLVVRVRLSAIVSHTQSARLFCAVEAYAPVSGKCCAETSFSSSCPGHVDVSCSSDEMPSRNASGGAWKAGSAAP